MRDYKLFFVILFLLLGSIVALAVTTCHAEMSLTLGPMWQRAWTGPWDLDIKGNNTIVEGRVLAQAPWVWGSIVFQSPTKFSGQLELVADTTIEGVKFKKSDQSTPPLDFDAQTSLQRIEVGCYAWDWARPYLTAESMSTEWTLTQVSTGKSTSDHKQVRASKPWAWVGGGVRVQAPLSGRLVAYADGSWLNGHQRYEGGLEYRPDPYYFAVLGRADRFSQIPISINGFGVELGVRF